MDQGPRENEFRQQRLINMQKLVELGYKPFGQAFERSGRLQEVLDRFAEGGREKIAGRIVSKRQMGKSIFAHLQDGSAKFQVYVKKDAVGEAPFAAFELLDLGDFIGAEGELFTTKTGERSLKVERWTMLSKALLPLPEKWHGLQDTETRYRHRYLDLIANPEVRELFNKRTEMIREIRGFLFARGFHEVETPMLQAMAGGAAANPFVTHYKALGQDMYMRIAPELYLKRLLVGGFDKVFELNRNFRNEGLDRSHNPEFTMLEIYEAYGDLRSMMSLVQDLITGVALAGETGEICEKLKKAIRDDGGRISPERLELLSKELGDVLWYIATLCTELGLNMQDVAENNLAKLAARKSGGKLHGDGDTR